MVLPLVLLAAAAQAAAPQASTDSPFAGKWAGSATVSSDEAGASCRYVGRESPPSVSLEIDRAEKSGTILVSLAGSGQRCPRVSLNLTFSDYQVSDNSITFRDNKGQQWALTIRGDHLSGLFQGTMSGEVDLGRAAVERRPGAGALVKGGIGLVAANVVGLGGIVALEALLKDKNQTTNLVNCSPRSCTAITAGNCTCNTNLSGGASCGNTTNGANYGDSCNPPTVPCGQSLSCNNGICEDLLGRCPILGQ